MLLISYGEVDLARCSRWTVDGYDMPPCTLNLWRSAIVALEWDSAYS